jgi:hypothetical protein
MYPFHECPGNGIGTGATVTHGAGCLLVASGVLAIDHKIPARSVELVRVQLPSPLDQVGTGLRVRRNCPASTAWSEVAIDLAVAVVVLQLCDVSLLAVKQILLRWIFLCWLLLHVDEHRLKTTLSSMSLSRPADTHLLTRSGYSLCTPFATISRIAGCCSCLIGSFLSTTLAIGAGRITPVDWTLVVVAVRRRVIQLSELELGVDGESSGPTMASSCTVGIACTLRGLIDSRYVRSDSRIEEQRIEGWFKDMMHTWLVVILWAPVNTIGPRVSLGHGAQESECQSSESADESLAREHDLCRVR